MNKTFASLNAASPTSPPLALAGKSSLWARLVPTTEIKITCWLLAHVGLGLAMASANVIAFAHALAVLGIGVWFAAVGGKLDRVAMVCAYLIGAEVIWRVAGAGVFYEYGKYALITICVVACVRNRLFYGSPLPVIYFVLLLPSSVMTMMFLDHKLFQQTLSFNLSGPLSLAVCFWFMSQVRITQDQLTRLLLALAAPPLSVAALAAFRIASTSDLIFGKSSNKAAAGGFGPNQVSATLGLGVLAAAVYIILEKRAYWMKLLMGAAALWMAAQSALTLSRTGLYLAAISTGIVAVFAITDPRKRMQIVVAGVLLLLLAYFVVLPRLDQFTGGALTARFQNTDLTSRDSILQADLQLWGEYPIFGVGPGMGFIHRAAIFDQGAAHTEYTRLLSEHGTFGLLALCLLFGMGMTTLIKKRAPLARGLTLALLCWAYLFMGVSAMRLAAPSFIFGLAALTLLPPTPLLRREQETSLSTTA